MHLEGPYISASKLGAQPDFARPASLDELKRLDALAPVRLLTLAPEVPGNMDAIAALTAAGFRVQIGHTAGGYEEGRQALERGARGFTHLFNAMTPLHHRLPGMVGAALAHAQYAEIIPDLLHVHPGAIRVALRSIPCLYCVTDSTAATGMPDGEYRLGRQAVTKCLGGVRLADGTLAGSTLTMDRALRNLVEVIGLDLQDAARRVSTYPADFLGLKERGRLVEGAWADVVVLDRDLRLQQVLIEGGGIDVAHAG
jgi:N-acetylglucosamine-6-phosphate deacetylase